MPGRFEKIIAVLGPTGSGKSQLGLGLAQALSGEIINCDSVQVYRGFDIGAAKPSLAEQQSRPHHLFDVVDGTEDFDAGQYAKLARSVVQQVQGRDSWPILVGGTGLYFRSFCGANFHDDLPADSNLRSRLSQKSNVQLAKLLRRLDPLRAEQVHINDRVRLERALELRILRGQPMNSLATENSTEAINPFTIIIEPKRERLLSILLQRTEKMFEEGLVAEVEGLIKAGISSEAKPMQTIGYKQVCAFLSGAVSFEATKEAVFVATRQYAKRQMTWFKKVPRAVTIEDPSTVDIAELVAHIKKSVN